METDPPSPAGERAVYFVVVLWGKRFRDYFLDFCLPSLLAPGNIPSLPPAGAHRLLVCTTPEDWAAMDESPVFGLLRQYVEPVLLPIPPAPDGVSGCEHMGVGHKIATDMAYEQRALVIHLTPDMMLSDGALARAMDLHRSGVHVVLAAALRLSEEEYFRQLGRLGFLDANARRPSESGQVLAIPSRRMAEAAIGSLHSETRTYEFDAPWLCQFPVAAWWRMADGTGMLIHSLSWAPIMLDYARIDAHDTSAIEHWTIDGDYIDANFSGRARFHVVTDSDEMMVTSWAPADDRPRQLARDPLRGPHPLGRWVRGNLLRRAYHSPVFDDMKRSCFALPVRWHAADIDATWLSRESECSKVAFRAVGLPTFQAGLLHRMSAAVFDLAMRMGRIRYYAYLAWRTLELVVRMALGQSDARQRLASRARQVLARVGLSGGGRDG